MKPHEKKPFLLDLNTLSESPLRIRWQSPANIALIKYWGKREKQIPQNASLAMTLKKSITTMTLYAHKKSDGPHNGIDLELFFEGQRNSKFEKRIKNYLSSLGNEFPYLYQLKLRLESQNSFPHSAGLASSSSSMSALALCLCSLERKLFNTLQTKEDFFQKASNLARLASGSSCRSIYGGLTLWGELDTVRNSSNYKAISLKEMNIHPTFKNMYNAILVASTNQKEISSSDGHKKMEQNPYAQVRYKEANERAKALLEALTTGNFQLFCSIVYREAMTLHSLMMVGDNPFTLWTPQTLEILNEIKKFQNQTKILVAPTMDAGPNIHLLFHPKDKDTVIPFIEQRLAPKCESNRWILDETGTGPLLIEESQ